MSLTTTLSTAVQSLLAAEGALQVTNNNIANANTPGYSREVVNLEEAPATDGAGGGVVFAGYQSVRDELLQTQIQEQTSQQSGANAQLSSLQQIEPTFTTSTQDIGTEMSALFSSLSGLSANPSDSTERQSVLTAAQNLATAFHSAASTLTSQQTGLNSQVTQDVQQVNQLTQQIAALNPQITAMQQTGQDAGTLEDQQSQLIQKLSQLTTVNITQSESGVTLTTGNGTPLVMGAQSHALQTTTGSDGMTHVLDANGNDITDSLTGGDLGGTVQMRDQVIPGLMSQLDTLANQFATAFNSAQASGFDQNGKAGTNFFTVPSTAAGSAAGIGVALTDVSQIAASSDGANSNVGYAGSNGNLANFAAVQTTALPAGATPGDAYANLVYQVGTLTANAQAESNAAGDSLQQLNTQLSSVSGVSIDEESANLVRYQQAYQASAQVINTVNNLFSVTMNMMTVTAG